MPTQAGNQTAIRAPGHHSRLYFARFTPSVIMAATVDTATTDGTTNLTITVTSGTVNDVKRGYLIRVETSGGVLKGVTNVRQGGTISSTNLPIHELGGADIDIAVGDVIKVYNIPYLADKLPTSDSTFAPDGVGSGLQGSNVAPNCRSGGHFIGVVDGFGTASPGTIATVPMAGSTSELLDPDSSTPGTHLWTPLTNTIAFAAGSSASDANPVIEASVGYGILLHVFDDPDASQSWSQFICFQVYDESTLPTRIIEATLNGDENTGWSADVELFNNADLNTLPDGSLVGLFAVEKIAGARQSFGNALSSRSPIKLIGFLHRDENEVLPEGKRVRLSIQSPLQRLASLPGFSKILTRTGADWTLSDDLTTLIGKMFLIHYYSFYAEMFDVVIDSAILNKAYSAFYINKQVALEQVRELADGVDARVTCLRTGEMMLHTHPCFIPEGDRSGVTTTYTIGSRDLLRMNFTREHWKPMELVETRGFISGASDNTPVFSRYPGNTPGRGSQTLNVERIIADDQDDSNERCGRRGAKADGAYITSSGVYYRAVEWSPQLPGSYDFFDFNKEYVATDLGATSNLRGVDLSAMRYYLSRISVRYHDGTADVEPVFLTATNAPPGSTYIPEDIPLPDYTPPDITPDPQPAPTSTIRVPYWNGTDQLPANLVCLAAGSAQFGYASWNGGSPSWVENSTGFSGSAGYHLLADPYNYGRYFACEDDAFYRNDNPKGGSSWSSVAGWATIFGDAARFAHYGEGSINRKGFFVLCNGGNVLSITDDYGVGFSVVPVYGSASYGTGLSYNSIDVAGSPFNNGSVGWFYSIIGSPNAGTVRFLKSTDWCDNWATVAAGTTALQIDTNVVQTPRIIVPYIRVDGVTPNINDASQEIFLVYGGANRSGIVLSQDGGATWTAKFYLNSGGTPEHPAGSYAGKTIHTFTRNGAIVSVATYSETGVRHSTNSGATLSAANIISGGTNDYANLNGSPVHSKFLVSWVRAGNPAANAQRIHWTDDGCVTDHSFDSPIFFTGNRFCANVQVDISNLIAPS